jgi:hypothetical protein
MIWQRKDKQISLKFATRDGEQWVWPKEATIIEDDATTVSVPTDAHFKISKCFKKSMISYRSQLDNSA